MMAFRLSLLLGLGLMLDSGSAFSKARPAARWSMVLEKPTTKKMHKNEQLKIASKGLMHPLDTEFKNDEIFVSKDAVQILKFHGSYMQDNRENRKAGQQKEFQFMLRLKMPAGELTSDLYRTLDDLATEHGQDDLRATTRSTFQLHGVLKGDLKTVIRTLMEAGSSTVGGCGDVNRNIMTSPAPKVGPEYEHMRRWTKIIAELFKPQSQAVTDLWTDGEKVSSVEYWRKDIDDVDVDGLMRKDNGNGIILENKEPIYGDTYLPRKFKMGVTVPGDNSLDLFTNDIGLVVITKPDGELDGFNVYVGGGMGRTHNKETTFARAADPLGFVAAEDTVELLKAIIATQRDHGDREIRANARMKYLVHKTGIEAFRRLVGSYFGKLIEPERELPAWKYSDWMGWHETGDGTLFLGVNIEQGRVRDVPGGPQLKTGLREIADTFNFDLTMTPTQSIIFRGVKPEQKADLEAMLAKHNIPLVEQIDPLVRLGIACPALPLCGLAQNEAERAMPNFLGRMRELLEEEGLGDEELQVRMTGCPNGCARPYMAELAFVGDGPKTYQLWMGGSPGLTRVGEPYANKIHMERWEDTMRPLFQAWKKDRAGPGEAFGDFVSRVGIAKLAKEHLPEPEPKGKKPVKK
uniref:assimilatory sulfite reductase (ferredoxin) n=1 Tax=Phaeomonas parva TaxID=124430 RepID=A0A6U4C2H1_9STRA|mmetsp:Transcript_10783/g.32723  ORF Transcript_10783/g.32723 Transcript_10783/m.32723 type:complete len:633 (+) Transcript_10783:299-2197(+)